MSFGCFAQSGWGFDTDMVLSAQSAEHLADAQYQGHDMGFALRYVSLGAPAKTDITVAERDNILSAHLSLGLVQHVERPDWQADNTVGTAHGQAAAHHAQLVEYPAGCHIGLDVEGLGDAGAPVYDYIAYWCDQVAAAGYLPLIYDGYQDGLTLALKAQLVTRGIVRASDWWSDFGQRFLPPGLAFAMKQHAQTTLAGVLIDPDEILVPGVVSFMGNVPVIATGSPPIVPLPFNPSSTPPPAGGNPA